MGAPLPVKPPTRSTRRVNSVITDYFGKRKRMDDSWSGDEWWGDLTQGYVGLRTDEQTHEDGNQGASSTGLGEKHLTTEGDSHSLPQGCGETGQTVEYQADGGDELPQSQEDGNPGGGETGQIVEHLTDEEWGDEDDATFMEHEIEKYVGLCGTRDAPGTGSEDGDQPNGDQSKDDEILDSVEDKVFMRKSTKRYVGVGIIKQRIPQEDGTSSNDGLGDQPKDGGRDGQRWWS